MLAFKANYYSFIHLHLFLNFVQQFLMFHFLNFCLLPLPPLLPLPLLFLKQPHPFCLLLAPLALGPVLSQAMGQFVKSLMLLSLLLVLMLCRLQLR